MHTPTDNPARFQDTGARHPSNTAPNCQSPQTTDNAATETAGAAVDVAGLDTAAEHIAALNVTVVDISPVDASMVDGGTDAETAQETVAESARTATSNTLPVPAATAEPIVRGRPFEPGMSGNPAGRPRGSRNKSRVALEEMLEGEAEALTRKMIDRALGGDFGALKFCCERLWPQMRDRAVAFEMCTVETAADAQKALAQIATACANGILSPAEARDHASVIVDFVNAYSAAEFEARLRVVEQLRVTADGKVRP